MGYRNRAAGLLPDIDGRWKRASGHPIVNLADESLIGTEPHATTADLDDALAASYGSLRVVHRLHGCYGGV